MERVLSPRQLNRALLARQLLLDRARLPVARALERMAGLQSQYAPSSYIGLWSRVQGFERAELTRALERRSVVQGTLMRTTIHIVSATDYWPLATGIRSARRTSWLKAGRRRTPASKMVAHAKRVRAALSDGPVSRNELLEIVRKHGGDTHTWNGVGLWVDLVRAPPSGTWERRRADLYALAEDWIEPTDATERQGLELLVRRYLGGFGPAPLKDIASWGGLPPSALESTVSRLKLRRFRDADGGELLDLPRAPLPDADTPAPVRFLPVWDATLLVHARRTGVLQERHRPLVFNTKTPQSVAAFLVDGTVAGTWRQERNKVRVEPFEPLPARVRRELDAEAKRLANFMD
jgi:hypothetical protein